MGTGSGWKRWTAAGVVGALLLVGGLAIGASASSSRDGSIEAGSFAASGALSASAGALDPSQFGPLVGVVHGDLHLQNYDGTALELTFDRGMITSRTGSSITFVRLDGQRVTVKVGPDTFVREGLRPASADVLHVGDRAMFFSHRNADGSLTAVLVRCISGLEFRS